ncbi:MerR family transcriptional regulator [Actinocatenispora sera]|nr:MerR family transcriptional regulator [Actinocatenispora sera]
MDGYLSIGDFSRATHLTIKMLRHYHQLGLLVPAEVDRRTGYRRYAADQLPSAQVIARFRELGMPLDQIGRLLATADPRDRNERITAHLRQVEDELERTRHTVAGLRSMLAGPTDQTGNVRLRRIPAVRAAAITEVVNAGDAVAWLQGAVGELTAILAAQRVSPTGPAGGIYADEVFTRHRGRATIFVPCAAGIQPIGRVTAHLVPPAEVAVMTHCGPPTEVAGTYAALAGYVARHAVPVAGPIREYYLVGQRDTADPRSGVPKSAGRCS